MTTSSEPFKDWFKIRSNSNNLFTVLFEPFGAHFKAVKQLQERLAQATGREEPLYNGYDWAMLFNNYIAETYPDFRIDDQDYVQIHSGTDEIMAHCDSQARADRLVEICVELLCNEAHIAQMILDGKAED